MNLFVSYAREDREFVRVLHAALIERKSDVWVDWEDIPPTAEWLAAIYAGIEQADTFLFVISPESASSATCRLEIAHALLHHKRIIPIMRRDAVPDAVPDAVATLNWVLFREVDDFDVSVRTLMQALDTDIAWVHAHTRLLVRALDWDSRARDESLLLRSRDLREARAAVAALPAGRLPAPTPLQLEFLRASEVAALGRRRRTIAVSALATTVLFILALAALHYSRQRDEQRRIAAANALNTRAHDLFQLDATLLPVSLLLALESNRLHPSDEAERFLREKVGMLPRPLGSLAHSTALKCVAFSPDGRSLATIAANDPDVRIWSLGELRLLQHSGVFAQHLAGLAFTPDGSSLFTAGLGGVTGWDLATGQQQQHFAEDERLTAIAISGDGKYVATGGHDGAVVVRSLGRWDEVMRGKHGMLVNALAWSKDSQFLASASNDKTARVWSVSGGQSASFAHDSGPRSVAWSPDGKSIATGGWDGAAHVWDVGEARVRSRFPIAGAIQSVAFSTDGTQLLAALTDKTARAWDITSESEAARMIHGGAVTTLAVGPDGHTVATGSADGTARLWDLRRLDEAARLLHPEWLVTAVAFDGEGKRLATVSDKCVRVWSVADAEELARFDHDDRVEDVTFGPGGNSVITVAGGSSGTALHVWDASSRQLARAIPVPDATVGFASDARSFSIGHFGKGVMVCDVDTGNVITRISEGLEDLFVSATAISPDGKSIAASVHRGLTGFTTLVWDATTHAVRCRIEHDSDTRALCFSPDSKSIAFNGTKNTLRIVDIGTSRDVLRLPHPDTVTALAFSPDGEFVATACRDFSARVWSTSSVRELARLKLGGVASDVAFHPDGKLVAVASSDRTARIWRWRVFDDVAPLVCSRVQRNLTREEWSEHCGDLPYHETCSGWNSPESEPESLVAVASFSTPAKPPSEQAADSSPKPAKK